MKQRKGKPNPVLKQQATMAYEGHKGTGPLVLEHGTRHDNDQIRSPTATL